MKAITFKLHFSIETWILFRIPSYVLNMALEQVSYDWSKGAENHNPAQARNYILLHPTQVIICESSRCAANVCWVTNYSHHFHMPC